MSVENRKAYFNYDILKEFEAGLELFGFETKALRSGQGSLDGAFVVVRGGEAYLTGATITPLQPKNAPTAYDAHRARRLLLNQKEIAELAGAESKKGLTVVPLSVYNKGRYLKLKLGIARGKRKFDKRETIKKRDTDREIRRTLKYE